MRDAATIYLGDPVNPITQFKQGGADVDNDLFMDLLAKRDEGFRLITAATLDKRVQEYIADRVLSELEWLLDNATWGTDDEFPPKTIFESPIEQLMMLALIKNAGRRVYRHSGDAVINPQYGITVKSKPYRVDFLVCGHMEDGTTVEIVVECDGHDFHEKSKEQAARDKSRDRALQSVGCYVLRFTGSEIWRTPDKCAQEVWHLYDERLGLSNGMPIKRVPIAQGE